MDDTHTHTYRKGAERNERYKNICLYLNFDAVKEEKLKNKFSHKEDIMSIGQGVKNSGCVGVCVWRV